MNPHIEQFSFSEAISQSLAGRTALLHLLPFSLAERQQTGVGNSVDDITLLGILSADLQSSA